MVAPLYFRGEIDLGSITQVSDKATVLFPNPLLTVTNANSPSLAITQVIELPAFCLVLFPNPNRSNLVSNCKKLMQIHLHPSSL